MDTNEIIKILEQAIEVERAELQYLTQIYLEKSKNLNECASLINKGQELDEIFCDLYRLKTDW